MVKKAREVVEEEMGVTVKAGEVEIGRKCDRGRKE